MAPELRIEMRLEGFEAHFEKVPGMGFPDWENDATPHTSILGPTRDPQRPYRAIFVGFRVWGLGSGPCFPIGPGAG